MLSADNSIPHLLSDKDLLAAFRGFYACTRPGGATLLTVRDYAREKRASSQLRPYGIRATESGRAIGGIYAIKRTTRPRTCFHLRCRVADLSR